MTVVWRIATDTPDYEADDMTGKGAEMTGGRWNPVGTPLVYAADSIALACLETLAHLAAGALPLNRFLVQITIPDDLIRSATRETATSLPVGWTSHPPGRVSIEYGRQWVASKSAAVLIVPSVIVTESLNFLINPSHSAASSITAVKVRPWTFDSRLR